MHFIFQYNYINLEYLDLQKKNLTNKGIKALQNKSLTNLKYLNISNNNITDGGLKYLSQLNNLEEFILLNMNNLSDDYFLSLQGNISFDKMKRFNCDKKKLTLKYAYDSYNDFNLPNLTLINIVGKSIEVHRTLKEVIRLDKICSKIKELDLSNTGLNDNGMFRLTKNIKTFKVIGIINLEGTNLTTYSKKYFELLEKQKIKIILNKDGLKPRIQKKIYKILLGGSTISGKTTYINSYLQKSFCESTLSSIGLDKIDLRHPKIESKKFTIFDTCRWNGRFDSFIQRYLYTADGVILLFDLSKKDDFDQLPYCLSLITDFYELEEFPVLLVGNKADLEKKVGDEDINQFVEKNKFIRYFEVSSKTLTNLDESINFMLEYIYEKDKVFPIDNTYQNVKRKK